MTRQQKEKSSATRYPYLEKYGYLINDLPSFANYTDEQKEALLEKAFKDPYLDLTSDFGFKHVLVDNASNTGLLLSDILGRQIEVIEFLPTEVNGATPSNKAVRFDVRCKSDDEEFIVEMQKADSQLLANRFFSYGSIGIGRQLKKKEDYRLRPLYVVVLLAADAGKKIFEQEPEAISSATMLHYEMMENTLHKPLYGSPLHLVVCRLKNVSGLSFEELQDDAQRILYIFANMSTFATLPEWYPERYKNIAEMAQIINLNDAQKRKYVDNLALEEEIAISYNEGKEDGRKEGREEGMQMGRQEQLKEDEKKIQAAEERAETAISEKLELAKMLVPVFLNEGIGAKEISTRLHLSEMQVMAIINELS